MLLQSIRIAPEEIQIDSLNIGFYRELMVIMNKKSLIIRSTLKVISVYGYGVVHVQ